jgi:hypothetical protein
MHVLFGRDNKLQPNVQDLLNCEAEGSLEDFEFDPAVCQRAFDHYDKDKSGYLDGKELMKLAEVSFLRVCLYKFISYTSCIRNCGTRFFPKVRNSPMPIRR